MGGESLPNNRWEISGGEVRRASTSRAYTDGRQTVGVRFLQGPQFGRDGSAYQPRLLRDQISRPWNRAKR